MRVIYNAYTDRNYPNPRADLIDTAGAVLPASTTLRLDSGAVSLRGGKVQAGQCGG